MYVYISENILVRRNIYNRNIRLDIIQQDNFYNVVTTCICMSILTKVPANGDSIPPRRAKADDMPIPTFL